MKVTWMWYISQLVVSSSGSYDNDMLKHISLYQIIYLTNMKKEVKKPVLIAKYYSKTMLLLTSIENFDRK